MTKFTSGDRVVTKSGRLGVVQPRPFEGMVLFTMVCFDDDGSESWIRTELLKPHEQAIAVPVKPKKRRRAI